MARNIAVKILRGVKANIPSLNQGELYYATDEFQLYIGTSSGNQLVLMHQLTGNGNGNLQTISANQKGTGGGPTNQRDVVNWLSIIISGVTYYLPLFQ